MVSMAFDLLVERGSNQHSFRAQGEVLTTSGGSVPMLRQRTRATLTVCYVCVCMDVCETVKNRYKEETS